jgi:hypothetical protein
MFCWFAGVNGLLRHFFPCHSDAVFVFSVIGVSWRQVLLQVCFALASSDLEESVFCFWYALASQLLRWCCAFLMLSAHDFCVQNVLRLLLQGFCLGLVALCVGWCTALVQLLFWLFVWGLMSGDGFAPLLQDMSSAAMPHILCFLASVCWFY